MSTSAHKWIDVDNRLPDSTDEYIVCCKEDDTTWVITGIYYPNGNVFQVHGEYPQVTYWMPLPLAPEKL